MPTHLEVLLLLLLANISLSARLPLMKRAPFNVGKYAALGDSFASGPSAGNSYDDTACRRYTQAYGPVLAADNAIQGPKPMQFSFIACSGARTTNIYTDSPNANNKPTKSQAGQLQGVNPDLVTLQIGGNDVGFVTLLDRCVYRFYDPGCKGCTPSFFFDDCTNDCQAAIDDVTNNIQMSSLVTGLQNSINAIFQNALNTNLFLIGYPQFWNAATTACNTVSFKAFCVNNDVLPLIQDRRTKMNALTTQLNTVIRNVMTASPHAGQMTFVDPNPFFDGHRFCEEGVQEPSYRNPNTYFYPFEYWTGGTLNFDPTSVASGDCTALYNSTGDDMGDFYACELANAALNNATTISLSNQTFNVQGDNDTALLSSGSSDALPDFLARIFHPTINGMAAIESAIVSAYSAAAVASASSAPTSTSVQPTSSPAPPSYVPGTCSFHLNETQTCEPDTSNLYATVKLLDNNKNVIGGTDNTANGGKGPGINAEAPFSLDSQLPKPIVITGEHQGDYVQFTYGSVSWQSTTKTGGATCTQGGWSSNEGCLGDNSNIGILRQMDCSFAC